MRTLITIFTIALGLSLANAASTASVTTTDDARCGKCGDGYCNPRCGETATSCPRDCGVSS